MDLLAETSWQVYFSNALAVAALLIPGIIYFVTKLVRLETKMGNGICSQLKQLREDLKSLREEHGIRIRDIEIADAKREGGKSDIHGG